MSELTSFTPISYLLPEWVEEYIELPSAINSLGLKECTKSDLNGDYIDLEAQLILLETLEINLVGIPGLSLAFLNGESDFSEFTVGLSTDFISTYLTFSDLSASLRISSSLIKKVELEDDKWVISTDEDGNPEPVEIRLENMSVIISDEFEINVEGEDGADATLALDSFQIGNTGIIVEIGSIQLILSEGATSAIPASTGIDSSSRGVYIESAKIHLPESLSNILPEEVYFENAFIGSGGFCGHVGGTWTVDLATLFSDSTKTLGGFAFQLENIDLDFKQNALLSCAITGYLKVPFFDAPVKVNVGITNDGDFTVAFDSTTDGGLYKLEKDGICTFTLSGLRLGKEDDVYYLALSGSLEPKLGTFDWPEFEVKELSITSTGEVHIDGGWIDIPDQKAFDFNGFKLEITRLGFGKDTVNGTDYNWIGFSGGIQIVNGLPMKGGVDGLKIMWRADGNVLADDFVKLQISGVALSFEIEKVMKFEGFAEFIDEADNKGFKGGVKATVIPLNGLGLNAQFVAGRRTGMGYNYFYIFIDASLPVGIPLIPPAAGMYGLAGLFGYNMTFDQNKFADDTSSGSQPDMTNADLWTDKENALAFGAGITVGSLPDNAFTVKVKALFAILLPGPIIMIQGQAKFLSVEENYPLMMLAVLDVAAGTFLMNISATYKSPKTSGALIDIAGSAEAYFNFNTPSDWHLYLGQDDPESKRIHAKILSFFTAETYLMVDNDMLKMGAWIGYGLDKKYGPLRVIVEAWIDGKLSMSRAPLQVEGSLVLHGSAELSAFGLSVGISVDANAKATAPNPLSVSAEVEVQLKTPLGNPKATVKLAWEKTGTPGFAVPFASGGVQHVIVSEKWDLSKQGTTLNTDGLYKESAMPSIEENAFTEVPSDVQLILNFDKQVLDTALVGSYASTSVGYEDVGDYEFKYELAGVALEYRGGSWDKDYSDDSTGWTAHGDVRGTWQATESDGTVNNTQLMLFANTPFEISRELENNESWLGTMLAYRDGYPCDDRFKAEWDCLDFEKYDYNAIFTPVLLNGSCIFKSDFPMQIQKYGSSSIRSTRGLKPLTTVTLRTCADIAGQAVANAAQFLIDKIVFDGGKNTAGPVLLELSKKRYEDGYGNTELYISSSTGAANGLASISFPEKSFPAGPEKVYVTAIPGEGNPAGMSFLTAYDAKGKVVATAPWKKMLTPGVFALVSTGDVIRKVTVTGSGIIITSVCFDHTEKTQKPFIDIIFPENMAEVKVWLSSGSKGSAVFLDENDAVVKTILLTPITVYEPLYYKPTGDATARVLRLSGDFLVAKMCTLNTEQYWLQGVADSSLSRTQETITETWGSHTDALLQPDSFYRVKVETKASRRKGSGEWSTQAFTEYLFFKTGKPPGVFTASGTAVEIPAGAEHYPERGALKDMSAYVGQTIPAEVAANEPRQPTYRSYDIGMTFTESYVDQLYLMGGYDIRIRLLDNNGNPATDADGNEIVFTNAWGENTELVQTREEEQWKAIAGKGGCVSFSSTSESYCQDLNASSTDLLLAPRTSYTAVVQAVSRTDESDTYSIYSFAFTTSAYAAFAHQAHSFCDAAWNNFTLLNDTSYAVDSSLLATVLRSAGDEDTRFTQLNEVFGLGTRTLPASAEVLALNDATGAYGLLFESPEPMEWDRIAITLASLRGRDSVEEFSGSVKITGGSVKQSGTDWNSQYVELLVMSACDLSGYTLQTVVNNHDGTTTLTPYYTFATGADYSEGATIRVYNGADDGSAISGVTSLFAGNTTHLLQRGGDTIGLVNDGEIVHSRYLYANADVTSISNIIVRNADGTRFFIFADDGSGTAKVLADGSYRLGLKFTRDISATDSSAPVLKRYGSSDGEAVALEFSLPGVLPG